MVLCATCIQVSCAKFLARVSRTRNLDRLSSALELPCPGGNVKGLSQVALKAKDDC